MQKIHEFFGKQLDQTKIVFDDRVKLHYHEFQLGKFQCKIEIESI